MPRKQKRYHFIYKTTNLLSGKYYIGMHSADTLDDGYMGSGTHISRSIKKHGKENHQREILEFCKSREDLKNREVDIVTLNEIAKKECMNLRVGGWGGGLIISNIAGRKQSQEHIEKRRVANTGKRRTEESKEKIRQSLLGKRHTAERRRNQSLAQQGKDQSANFGPPRRGEDSPVYIPISPSQEREIIKLHVKDRMSAKKIAPAVGLNWHKVLKLLRDAGRYIPYGELKEKRRAYEGVTGT